MDLISLMNKRRETAEEKTSRALNRLTLPAKYNESMSQTSVLMSIRGLDVRFESDMSTKFVVCPANLRRCGFGS